MDNLSYNELWNAFLKYDVREIIFKRTSPGRGYVVMRGSFPDIIQSSITSRVWSFQGYAMRFMKATWSCISEMYYNGLDVEPIVYTNFYDDSIKVPFESGDDLPF